MPDILLIQPPIRDYYLTAKRTMPYGLASVAGALRQAGFSVDLFDALATSKSRVIAPPEGSGFVTPYYGRPDHSPFALFHHFRHYGYSITHIVRKAKDSGAWLIGISSLFSAYADIAVEIAAAVKNACPGVAIVLGGHHPSALPEDVMQHPSVDYILRGDGEPGLPKLAEAIQTGNSVDRIPGLVWRTPEGHLTLNPPSVIGNLDSQPLPAFDLIHWRFYQRAGKGGLAISAGRGCPLRCTYCAVNAATYHGYRCRSVDAVMAEIKAADRIAPLGFIDFEDEHLTADRQWFLDLLAALRNYFGSRTIELRAMNGLYAATLDREVVGAMAQTGFKALNMALITTDGVQLKRFGRLDVTPDMDRVLTFAHEYGLESVVYIIVAGPQQDPFVSIRDLLYLAQRRVLAGVSVFYPAPGSIDYRWCAKHHLLPDQLGLMRATLLPLEHVTRRIQSITLLRLGRVLNFMKSLLDEDRQLPMPALSPAVIDGAQDRKTIGRILLSAFLHDAKIRGVDGDGKIYEHQIDGELTRIFLEGVTGIELKGTK